MRLERVDGELVVEGLVGEADRERIGRRRLDLIAAMELRRRGLRQDGIRRFEDGRIIVRHPPFQERRPRDEGGDWAMEEPYRW